MRRWRNIRRLGWQLRCRRGAGRSGGQEGAGGAWIKFLFTFGDHEGGDAVADDIGDGAGFAHEFINGEQEREAFDGDLLECGEGGGEDGETAAGDAGGHLGGDHQDADDAKQLSGAEVDVVELGEEDNGHGQVDGGAVEVEGIAGRDDEAHHGLAAAHAFEFQHEGRLGGFGGGGAQDDEDLFADILEVGPDAEFEIAHDPAQYDKYEDDHGAIDGAH